MSTISLKEIKKVVEQHKKDNNRYAIVNYLTQITFTPENEFYVRSELGRSYNNRGDHEHALKQLLWVDQQEQGKNTSTQYHLAYAYLNRHHYHSKITLIDNQKVLDYSNKGIQLDKKYAPNYYNRAEAYKSIWYYTGDPEDYQKALADYQTYFKLSKDEEAHIWIAQLYAKELDETYDEQLFIEAIALLEKHLKKGEYNWEASRAKERLDQIKEAARDAPSIIPIPSYIANWQTYSDELYGKPCEIKVDEGLQTFLPITDFQEQVWVAIPLKNVSEEGLIQDAERAIIAKIENALTQKLAIENAIYSGYIQKNGRIDFFFYSNPIKHLERRIDQVMYHFQQYSYDWEVNKGSVWLDYTDLMMPEAVMA